jgi:hypothetical protein
MGVVAGSVPGAARRSVRTVPPGRIVGRVGAVGVRRWRLPSGARCGPLRETSGPLGLTEQLRRRVRRGVPELRSDGRGPGKLKFWEPEWVAECAAE